MTQDNFTILEMISQSPTTSVYKAHQNVLGRTVLLKVLHKHLLRDKDLVTRFSREAKACAILKSENIVQVYDLTEVDGAPAIVMEYVEGESLEDMLRDAKARSEELASRVAVSVLKALSYAHDRGVTHRDIKPGNILVSEDGTIKVTDFGLAAVSDAPSLTMEGSLIGTPAYMSPEQARGESVDQRTDLFSLGVTLVEVITGDKILAGRSYAECLSKIQSFGLESINYIEPKCSPQMFEFLKRLLAPDKYDRFASAGEALAFFEEDHAQEKSTLEKPSVKLTRTRSGLLAGAVVVVIAVVVGLSFVFRHSTLKPVDVPADSTIARIQEAPAGKAVPSGGRAVTEPNRPVGRDNLVADRKKTDKNLAAAGKSAGESKAPAIVPKKEDYSLADDGAVSDSGYISVRCTPWGKIFVDDEYAGTTPISGSIKIPVGEHTVTFSNPNFAPIVRRVDVRKDFLSSIDADFLRNAGYLIVSVEPWGKVYVDDQFRETTPSARPIVVSAGTRRIRIENPNFPDIVKTITVPAGDTLRLNFRFHSQENN